MKCAECIVNEASYAIEILAKGMYSGRTTIWKYLCVECFEKLDEKIIKRLGTG